MAAIDLKLKDKWIHFMIASFFLTPKQETFLVVTKPSVLNSLGITNSLLSISLKKNLEQI